MSRIIEIKSYVDDVIRDRRDRQRWVSEPLPQPSAPVVLDRVLRYKVEKALREGFKIERSVKQTTTSWSHDPVYEKCITDLAELVGRPHERGAVELLVEELIPDPNRRERVPRDYATIEELVEYMRPMFEREGMDGLERARVYYSSACACMGPQGDDPLCPCAMRHAVHQNLDDIKMRFAHEAHES